MTKRLILILLFIPVSIAAMFSLAMYLVYALAGHKRAWHIALAQDQAVNAGFGGSEDETISSRAGKSAARRERWGCVLCKLLDKLDPGHCQKSIETDEGKPFAG